MKTKYLYGILIYFFILFSPKVHATAFIVGTDTIHFLNGNYYYLGQNDSALIDSTVITIKFSSGIPTAGINLVETTYNLTKLITYPDGISHYNLPAGIKFPIICNQILSENVVENIEIDYFMKLHGFDPDDDYLNNQWYLENIGVYNFTTSEGVWEITKGSRDVIVAVLDIGLDWDSEEFGPINNSINTVALNDTEPWNIWDNPESGDGFDSNDPYNYADDYKGWDFRHNEIDVLNCQNDWLGSDNDVRFTSDQFRHGNAVAGIIAAKTNNSLGISGIAGGDVQKNESGVKVLPIKVGDFEAYYSGTCHRDGASINTADVRNAIYYAVDMGAKVINMSFGLVQTGGNTIDDAINYAYENNVTLVVSVGNEGYPFISYPARHSNVIAVGATTQNDNHWVDSNTGPQIDIAAPGQNITVFENYPQNDVETNADGTSFSAPMVSATVGLMLSVNPYLDNGDWNTEGSIMNILKRTADKTGEDQYVDGWNSKLGYGRLNTYKAVCMAIDYIPELLVTNNATWTDRVISQDITIETGVSLTIKGDVLMGENASIVVKPGAELIIDGGTITNIPFCNNENKMWNGIEVWGQSNESQYGQPCAQGKLILKNGASIENAIKGVFVGAYNSNGTFDLAKSGGIVQVMGNNSLTEPSASFINNEWAVTFTPYRNFQPGNPEIEMANLSYFKNALFMVDNDYHYAPWYKEMVRLYGISNINFSGCTFSNLTNDRLGIGLYTLESGFRLKAICTDQMVPCPKNFLDKCTFDNFYKGIAASNAGKYTFTVEDAVFTNNSYGIKMTAVNNATILSSTFNIGGPGVDEIEKCGAIAASAYGVYTDNCTGFAIEENDFTKAQGAPTGNYVGVRIANTLATDEIYNNIFYGLSNGNLAEGKNWYLNNSWKGLAYFCNENAENYEDFHVSKIPDVPSGIQSEIGSTSRAAGNTFSDHAYNNFNNLGDHEVTYFYYNSNPAEYPDIVYHVGRELVSTQNQCLSHYGGGSGTLSGPSLSPGQIQQAELDYASNNAEYNNVLTLYNALKDGGNTSDLKTDVATAWPQDMLVLRADLLAKSPHLSMEVLKETADKTDVFPESVIFEIMAANPDELKNEELIKYLVDKANPLPTYMIDILRQISTGTTYKTVMHRQMAYYNQLKTRAAHDMIRSLLNDSVTDNTQLRNWFANLGGVRADEQIIATYMQQGSYSNALALANTMPASYAYTGNDLTEHNFYMDMLNFQISIAQQGRHISELDSTELASLVYFADSSRGTAGALARGILDHSYGYNYCNCLNVTDTLGFKSSEVFQPDATGSLFGFELRVEPNPANEWTVFHYTMPDAMSISVVSITDVYGKLITTLTINGTQGQKFWDTRSLKPGVYYYNATSNGVTQSGKIVVNN